MCIRNLTQRFSQPDDATSAAAIYGRMHASRIIFRKCTHCALSEDELTLVLKLPGVQTHTDPFLGVFIDSTHDSNNSRYGTAKPSVAIESLSTVPAPEKAAPR